MGKSSDKSPGSPDDNGEDPGVREAGFREVVGPVKPVRSRRLPLRDPPPRPRAGSRRADERAVLDEIFDLAPGEIGLESGDELSFRRDHVRPDTLRRLRRGEFAVQDELDLHGMTMDQARVALRAFLIDVRSRDLRCVRIVHGKGLRSGSAGPVLKLSVNRWLRKWDAVLAFSSAPPVDGGTDALYFLLGSRRTAGRPRR